MEVWKISLGDMTNQTTHVKNNIQEMNIFLKNGYLPRKNMCGQSSGEFYGLLLSICSWLQP